MLVLLPFPILIMIDRDFFYNKYKELFGSLNQSQVDAINFLLDKLDESKFSLASEYAYILATIKHETADTYKPITEYGSQSYLKSKKYWPYIGRGYVQLTWLSNYKLFGDLLKIDLIKYPDYAKEPEIAWQILELGMSQGLFTGKQLSDYITEQSTDYINARRIINGKDKASLIAGYAEKFYSCISYL